MYRYQTIEALRHAVEALSLTYFQPQATTIANLLVKECESLCQEGAAEEEKEKANDTGPDTDGA